MRRQWSDCPLDSGFGLSVGRTKPCLSDYQLECCVLGIGTGGGSGSLVDDSESW